MLTILRQIAVTGIKTEATPAPADENVVVARLQEEVLRWEQDALQEASDRPPITFYRVHLRACVALPVGSRDAYFVLTGELNKPSFVAGEEARLTMRCGRECYVTIFNLAANDRFSILFPNSYESVVALRSREVSATRRKGALN